MCRLLICAILFAGGSCAATALGQEHDPIVDEFNDIKSDQALAREKFNAFFLSDAGKDKATWPPIIAEFSKRTHKNCDRSLGLARHYYGHPVSVEMLKFVVESARGGPSDHSAQAFAEMQLQHVNAPALGAFLEDKFWISEFNETDKLIREVAESHPDPNQRGYAKFGLAKLIMRRCEQKRAHFDRQSLGADDHEPPSKLSMSTDLDTSDAELRQLLHEVVANHAEVPYGEDRRLGQIAQSKIEGYFKLRTGSRVSNITGRDTDGESFSLDDYSGQIRLVVFTGDWCAPCKAMYPQLRGLQMKFGHSGLIILGVSTDEDIDSLKRATENKEITWRCWWDKGFGQIVNEFGVSTCPTILVVDRQGVLRFKGLRDETLLKAIEKLCSERDVLWRQESSEKPK